MFNFFAPKIDPVVKELFETSKKELGTLENSKPLSRQGKFEALILFAYIILNRKNNNELTHKYLRHLVNIRKDYGVNLSSGDTVDFVNNRTKFFATELHKLYNTQGYINGTMYNVIFENPLTPEPKQSFDLPEIIKFNLNFSVAINSLNN